MLITIVKFSCWYCNADKSWNLNTMIDSYRFGCICINGKVYAKDVIICSDKVQDNWWRKEGHKLAVDDIRDVVERENPSTLVVGTGKFGVMHVLPETKVFLEEKKVHLIVQTTDQACETFNNLVKMEKVVGTFHLTC
jgi:hypothetical protein